MSTTEFYQDCLAEELARRAGKNPRYSLRAFAKALEIDVASLSRILSGRQTPSHRVCESLFAKLELSPGDQQRFLVSVVAKQKALGLRRRAPAFRKITAAPADRVDLSTDAWRIVADWVHGAIMELTFLDGFQSDGKWIARELGISEVEARQAIKRLLRLGLLEERNGTLVKTYAQVASGAKNITTSAHKRLQKQVLEKAVNSLENDPLELRNMTSMVMAIDPERIPQAKKMIQEFSRELCAYLEAGKRKRVYQLGICLYPISKTIGGKK